MVFNKKSLIMEKIVNLTQKRKGEIALVILREEFIKKAQTLNRTDVMRNIGQAAEKLKGIVTKEELISLYKELIEDAVKKLF